MRGVALLLTVGAVGLVALPVAAGRPAADPGVSPTGILIGGTTPLSGEASSGSATAIGAEAYFKYLNARGGVNGRRITYKFLDDGYDPGRTVQATRQLVQQDRVFAIFNSLGTAHNLAIRPFLNEVGVPHLFIASGYGGWARDGRRYPYSLGYIPSYTGEGQIYARHLLAGRPRAKIAVLYQDDDYGREMIAGLKRGLGSKARQIVAQESYDPAEPNVESELAKLKASGADTFMNFAFGKFAIQSFVYAKKLRWRPARTYVNAVASSSTVMQLASEGGTNERTEGAVTVAFFKDPASSRWARDRGYRLFRSIVRKYIPGGSVKNGYYMAGMASAFSMADALRKAGKNPTRRSLMAAVRKLDERNNPFVLPGIRVQTSASDRYPIEQAQLQRWRKGQWRVFGSLQRVPRA